MQHAFSKRINPLQTETPIIHFLIPLHTMCTSSTYLQFPDASHAAAPFSLSVYKIQFHLN